MSLKVKKRTWTANTLWVKQAKMQKFSGQKDLSRDQTRLRLVQKAQI